MTGRPAEALATAEKACSLRPWDTTAIGLLAGLLAREGETTRADALIAQLTGRKQGAAIGLAMSYLVRLDTERFTVWMEKAIAERDARVPYLWPYSWQGPERVVLSKALNLTES